MKLFEFIVNLILYSIGIVIIATMVTAVVLAGITFMLAVFTWIGGLLL